MVRRGAALLRDEQAGGVVHLHLSPFGMVNDNVARCCYHDGFLHSGCVRARRQTAGEYVGGIEGYTAVGVGAALEVEGAVVHDACQADATGKSVVADVGQRAWQIDAAKRRTTADSPSLRVR